MTAVGREEPTNERLGNVVLQTASAAGRFFPADILRRH